MSERSYTILSGDNGNTSIRTYELESWVDFTSSDTSVNSLMTLCLGMSRTELPSEYMSTNLITLATLLTHQV